MSLMPPKLPPVPTGPAPEPAGRPPRIPPASVPSGAHANRSARLELRLPTREDLTRPATLLQVVIGFAIATSYAPLVNWVVGHLRRDPYDVTLPVLALAAPLVALVAIVWLLKARALGRGFVLGFVVSVVVATAFDLI